MTHGAREKHASVRAWCSTGATCRAGPSFGHCAAVGVYGAKLYHEFSRSAIDLQRIVVDVVFTCSGACSRSVLVLVASHRCAGSTLGAAADAIEYHTSTGVAVPALLDGYWWRPPCTAPLCGLSCGRVFCRLTKGVASNPW